MKMATLRNFLIVLGCYKFSMWVVLPFVYVHGKITSGITYTGTSGAILMHIVSVIPLALISFGSGVLCKRVLEGPSRTRWVLSLALLYASGYFFGFRWAIKPELSDRALQFIPSIIPAITCYIGSRVPMLKK